MGDAATPRHRTILDDCGPDDAANIADTAHDHGRYAIAETAWRTVHDVRTTDLGAEHPDTLTSRSNLANVLRDLKQRRGSM